MVRDGIAGSDAIMSTVLGQTVFPFQVLQYAVVDDEAGGEHGGSDLAAVATMADDCTEEPVAFSGL